MEGAIRVSDEGLYRLAAQCETVASQITGGIPVPTLGPPGQATSAAVTTGHTHLGTAAGVLAARMGATGTKLAVSGVEYLGQEKSSVQRIASVDPSMET